MGAPLRLQLAAGVLHAGGILACPTEAVWGLSCDPFDQAAVNRLLLLKRRPVEKGLILVAADMAQLDFLLRDLSDGQRKKLEASWPGPNSWLVPHRGRVPAWIHGEHDTVAVRVSETANRPKSLVSILIPDDKERTYPSSFKIACRDPGDSWPSKCDKSRCGRDF